MAKLSDAEFATRTRERNRMRSERRRERLQQAGKLLFACWIEEETRAALEREAAQRGLPVGQTAAELLREALRKRQMEAATRA